jgi:hypothetical protein
VRCGFETAEGAAPARRIVCVSARRANPPFLQSSRSVSFALFWTGALGETDDCTHFVHVRRVTERQVQSARGRHAVLGSVPLALEWLATVPDPKQVEGRGWRVLQRMRREPASIADVEWSAAVEGKIRRVELIGQDQGRVGGPVDPIGGGLCSDYTPLVTARLVVAQAAIRFLFSTKIPHRMHDQTRGSGQQSEQRDR